MARSQTSLPAGTTLQVILSIAPGFMSRKVSSTLGADFSQEAVEEAMESHGKLVIVNTGQGNKITSYRFTGLPEKNSIQISMDGKGAWRGNVFVERLWGFVKYGEVYLHGYHPVLAAKAGLSRHLRFYNNRQPQSILDLQTSDQISFESLPLPMAAQTQGGYPLINSGIAVQLAGSTSVNAGTVVGRLDSMAFSADGFNQLRNSGFEEGMDY